MVRLRQPGIAYGADGAEAKGRASPGPWQRNSATVPTRVRAAGAQVHWVLQLIEWQVLDLFEAEFFALVDVQGARQGGGQQCRGPRSLPTELDVRWNSGASGREGERGIRLAIARHRSGHVMVGQDPGGGSAYRRMGGQRAIDRVPQTRRIPRPSQEVEVEGRVELVGPEIVGKAIDVRKPDLADQNSGVGIGIRQDAPAAVDLMQLVAVSVGMLAGTGRSGDLGQGRVLHEQHCRVDPDAGDAAVEPEAQHCLVLGPNVGVAPVLSLIHISEPTRLGMISYAV